MWRCINCKGTTFRKDNIIRRYVKFDKNRNIKSDTRLGEIIERIKCNECDIYSDNINDIAEWEDE